MSSINSKQALIIQGPGFMDQNDIAHQLNYLGYKVVQRMIGFGAGQSNIPELRTAGVVILRGTWNASPEDRLMLRLLAERSRTDFAALKQQAGQQQVLAIGRGALLLLESEVLGPTRIDQLGWEDVMGVEGPWIEVTVPELVAPAKALVLGRSRPLLDDAQIPGLAPWLTWGETTVGWRKGSWMISMVDILAYAQRQQLAEYGYSDLTGVPTQAELLESLLKRA